MKLFHRLAKALLAVAVPFATLATVPGVANAGVINGDAFTLTFNPIAFTRTGTAGAGDDIVQFLFLFDVNGGAGNDVFTWISQGAGALAGSTSITVSDLDFTGGQVLSGFNIIGSPGLTGVTVSTTDHSFTFAFTNNSSGSVGPGPIFSGSYVLRDSSAVPEPGSLALIGLGLAGLGFVRRKRAIG